MPTLRLAKSLWGVPEADIPERWDNLFARIKAEGFDGVEAITLTWRTDRDRFVSLLKKHGLQLICQIHTSGGDLDPATGYVYCSSNKLHDHLASFVKLTAEAKALGAVLINSHSGHDSWGSGDKAVAFFKHALLVEAQLGVPVVHETHRQRLLYSPYTAAELLSKPELAALKVNADLSHWCCVCEKVFDAADPRDDWWPATLRLVAEHCEFVHARVGHAEGPQVSDPSAPEFAAEVSAHASWWRTIWAAQAARHPSDADAVWAEPEHGPPPYLQTLPFSQQPVADLWEVNARMAQRVRTEHAAAMREAAAATAAPPAPPPSGPDFIAGGDAGRWGMSSYMGPKDGYVFREQGPRGAGYYREGTAAARAGSDAPAGPEPAKPAPSVGRDGSLLRAAMDENPDVADKLASMMGGDVPPVAPPAGEDEAATAASAEKLRAVDEEGVAVGARLAAQQREGAVEFACASASAPGGDLSLLERCMGKMNLGSASGGGGAAEVAKMVFSAGAEQLSLVTHVPESKRRSVDAAAWTRAVLAAIGGKVMCSAPQPAPLGGGSIVLAAVSADGGEHEPDADMALGLAAAARFLEEDTPA